MFSLFSLFYNAQLADTSTDWPVLQTLKRVKLINRKFYNIFRFPV